MSAVSSTNREPVFVHVPKTGGASILQICLRHGIRVIDHDLRNPAHVSLARYRSHFPHINTFAVVRNPWDRVVSTYHYLRKGGIKPEDRQDAERFVARYDSFNEFVLAGFNDKAILDQIHFRPQYLWLSDDSGLIVDQTGKFEKLRLYSSRWFNSIGLRNCSIPHVNKGTHMSYRTYYTEQTIEIVRDVYRTDIELFKYTF